MSKFSFVCLAGFATILNGHAASVTVDGGDSGAGCPNIMSVADCTTANNCVATGPVTISATSTAKCYTIANDAQATVEAGYTGTINALGTIMGSPATANTCTVTLGAGVSLAGFNSNGCKTTGDTATFSSFSINGGEITVKALSLPGSQTISPNGGEITLGLTDETNLSGIDVNGGTLGLTMTGSVGSISVNGGTTTVATPSTIGPVDVNGGTLTMGATTSIGAVSQNGGEVVITGTVKPASYSSLGGTCQGCPANSNSF